MPGASSASTRATCPYRSVVGTDVAQPALVQRGRVPDHGVRDHVAGEDAGCSRVVQLLHLLLPADQHVPCLSGRSTSML